MFHRFLYEFFFFVLFVCGSGRKEMIFHGKEKKERIKQSQNVAREMKGEDAAAAAAATSLKDGGMMS